ncbi:Rsp5p-dependent ubiquitination, sorting of cargo proteins at the multivesicular body [Podila minutissima]|nr:Rsp5p-dependent ubiquitination, sorting of cargo proteins at the multivesicular body [Podila minutissima]
MPSQAWKRELSRQRLELEYEQWQQEQLEGFLDAILYDENSNHDNNNNDNSNFYNYPVPSSTRTENEKYFYDTLPPPTFTYAVPPPPDDGEDEDVTWLVVAILLTALFLLIASLVRSCSQRAGMWLNGGSWNNDSPHPGHGGPRPFGHSGPGGPGGHGGRYPGSGPFQVPEDDDDEANTSTAQLSENDERLALLSDAQRQAYDSARAFQAAHPPGSVPTDISLSQYLSIQEKGVSAWEFEPSYDSHLSVHDRTELAFQDQEASVQTNLPLPKQQEVYYWEVKMFEKSPNTVVSVGVSTKPYPATRLPGWNRQSVAYFSKDGQKYCNSPFSGYPYGPIYFEGDVVGCGYRPRTGTIFFTRNGKRLEDAYTGMMRHNLFPTVGATGPCVLHVNFGQSGFVFVEANVKKWGLAPASGTLAPPPAYGSERGSILLEAGAAHTPAPPTRRPKLQSSQSRARIEAAGVLVQIDQEPSSSNNGPRPDFRKASPVHISLSNMSAPTGAPPHYSSLGLDGADDSSGSGSGKTPVPTTIVQEGSEGSSTDSEEEDEARALIGGGATIERLSSKGRTRSGTLNSVASGSGSSRSRR